MAQQSKARPTRVVVLGGLGFMGSHICRELLARDYAVRVFDKLYTSRELIVDIEHDIAIVEGDIMRPNDVLDAIADADILIHLVHTTRPGSSMVDPAFDVSSNVVASVEWLPLLPKTKVRRIIFVSSGGTVYGIPQSALINESHSTDPICSYGITKLAIEKYISMYASMNDIEFYLLRPSNVYGEGQRLNVGQGVIGVMADRALSGEPMEIWGTGKSLRDYLYIEDMVSAMMAVLSYEGPQHVFNVSSGRGYSVLDIVRMLKDALGFIPEVIHKPDRGFDVPMNVLDSTRLRRETGWEPRVDIGVGIARIVGWLKSSRSPGSH